MADATERWVERLNKLARQITTIEQTVHPSAWPEMTRDDVDAYRKLAATATKDTPHG